MEDIVVTGRDVQLSQVIVNLLSNASDAVKDLPVRKIEIALEKSDSQLDILFKDSGRGVPLEIRSRIMDPFFTTKEVNQGTGLGLSISKTIMQEHDGELSFLPEEKMTTFRMRLPMKTKQRPVILAKDA
jgi:C4-dicarboxylate-specific signal transduction histidine kinase